MSATMLQLACSAFRVAICHRCPELSRIHKEGFMSTVVVCVAIAMRHTSCSDYFQGQGTHQDALYTDPQVVATE
jgi:hypothetical protein